MTASFFGFDLAAIAEERIQAAIRRGELDNLPGAGKPLPLDDDLLVPPEARIANRILKNAGLVPQVEGQRAAKCGPDGVDVLGVVHGVVSLAPWGQLRSQGDGLVSRRSILSREKARC